MTFDEYQEDAGRTVNPDLDYERRTTQGVFGLVGETGETVDMLKKHLYHGHILDREKLAEELGDILWYVAELASVNDLKLSFIVRRNISKLLYRYPGGFDSYRSINRGR